MNKFQLIFYIRIILLFLNTILLVVFLYKFQVDNLATSYFFACFFSYIFSVKLNNRSSLASIILTIYHFIVGPINLLYSRISPVYLVTSSFNNFYGIWLFDQSSIIFEYVLLLNISISIILIILSINVPNSIKLSLSNIFKINFPKIIRLNYSIYLNIFWLFFISIFEFYLRISFNLNIPGSLPLITGAGFIVYFLDGYKLYLISIIHALLINKYSNKFRFLFIGSLISIGIYSIPSLLIGQRAPILNAILSLVLFFVLILNQTLINLNTKLLRSKLILALSFIIFSVTGFIALGAANYIRTGEFEVITFLLRRITGLYDGLIFLHYKSINQESFHFGIFDFMQKLIFDYSMSPNKFYTLNILGYPSTAVHGSAVPFYVSALYYGGIFGLTFISLYFGLLIKFVFVTIDQLVKEISNKYSKFNHKFILFLFPSIYFFGLIFWSNIIDGDITNWKLYSVPIISYCLVFFTKVND